MRKPTHLRREPEAENAMRHPVRTVAGWKVGAAIGVIAMAAISAAQPLELDSAALEAVERRVAASVLSQSSSPVSLYGEARLKIQNHDFRDYPPYLRGDRAWTQANWEESVLQLGIIAKPSRHATLWTKLGFHHTLPGNYTNSQAGPNHIPDSLGYRENAGRHNNKGDFVTLHEDMAAGLAVTTVPASFLVRLGSILWTQASPLSVWKTPPRNFAWDYLPFEHEQTTAEYYADRLVKGDKVGRAAWNKKPFQGLGVESLQMPWDLSLNLVYGQFDPFDKFEREYVDWYQSDAAYRSAFHGRLAKGGLPGGAAMGYNHVHTFFDRDAANTRQFRTLFAIPMVLPLRANPSRPNPSAYQGFFKESQVHSVDAVGELPGGWAYRADIAWSALDTFHVTVDSMGGVDYREEAAEGAPAFYGQLRGNPAWPIQADFAFIAKGFYSPFSFAVPMDAFYPFGSNLLGQGKFFASGENAPYAQNMAGINLGVSPPVPGGRLKVAYGQHFQLKPARDLLFFPYRLHGMDLFRVFQSSYARWGYRPVDFASLDGYDRRLGDESFDKIKQGYRSGGPEAGGLRSDFMGMYEGFVAYESQAQADSNLNEKTGFGHVSRFVPAHRKWTFNLDVDGTWDIGPLVGWSDRLFLSAYGSVNGISTGFRPLAISHDKMLLWGTLFRFEPAMALTRKFYLIGLLGIENWKSDKAYMLDPESLAENAKRSQRVPLDFRDTALGLGFDWDVGPRVGLHGRYKWMWHRDEAFAANDWSTPHLSGEVKMWF